MNDLQSTVELALQQRKVSLDRFQQIVIRLLEYSAICYGDSQVETDLYHDAERIELLLADYFSLMGCRLFHEPTFRYFRLYPPGADVPGVATEETAVDGALRLRLTQQEVALALVLCFIYDEGVRQGQMDDDGEVAVPLVTVFTTMMTVLNRSASEGSVERRRTFQRLKNLKVLRFDSDADLENPETLVIIRPHITAFVHLTAIQALDAALEEESKEEAPDVHA